MRIVNLLKTYAQSQNDEELASKIKITLSKLRVQSDRSRLSLVKNYIDLAIQHEDALEDYGLESGEILALMEKVEAYEAALVSPRTAVVNRHLITLNIESKGKALDALLQKELDPFMVALKNASPSFVKLYKSARLIIDHKGKKSETLAPPEQDDENPETQ